MSAPCPGLAYGDAFVGGALTGIDCQARAIAAFGYQALAAPGSSVMLVVTGLLTLFVALFGYRLMLGETPGVRDGVVAIAKIGIVLALATSWATYRTLAYDVVLGAPAELVASVGGAAGLPGTTGGMAERLGLVDQGLAQLNDLGVGRKDSGEQVMRVRNIGGRNETVVESAQQPVGVVEPIALALARAVFLLGAVGSLVVVRLVAAILLALGPVFVAFLLFDATRGWFAGWLRGLSAAMIGAFGVALVLGVELALVEPWLAGLVARRVADESISGAPVELLAAMLVFAVTILGVLAAAARVAGGFRLPDAWSQAPARWAGDVERQLAERRPATAPATDPAADRPRAAAVADAVIATQRREAAVAAALAGRGARGSSGGAPAASDAPDPARLPAAAALARDTPGATAPPLGHGLGRRTRNRVSASAGRRDSRR
ncbi:type IV secretion system protein [Sphingomonas donggukensis]|uniref:Type IV secretion system protein n=1 Tax=Sphingomonas donggukensis TaxID=2949093 RepID=A0ABY4TSJ6_9SPHN|nr:type IV secretion system protein [Sphingomonas donggukensis]URW74904.1 type IV secretion system protein [Sphingomonas donggukensis]